MYKVMLVDDDPVVLMQLRQMLNWNKWNCEIVFEATKGEDALAQLERLHPDVIFTDVSMPGITGIDLIDAVHKRDPGIKIVALSAFDNFDYVRNSLTYGAVDYLLKYRINTAVLEEFLAKITRELDSGRIRTREKGIGQQTSELFYRILNGTAETNPADREAMHTLGVEWLSGELTLAIGGIDEYYVGDAPSYAFDDVTVKVVIDETIRYYHDYYCAVLDRGIFLILFASRGKTAEELCDVVEQIQTTLDRFCSLKLSFFLSDPIPDYRAVPAKKDALYSRLMDLYFNGKSHFLYRWESAPVLPSVPPRAGNYLEALGRQLLCGEEAVREFFRDFFRDMELPREQTQLYYAEFISLLLHKMQESGISEAELLRGSNPYNQYHRLKNPAEICGYLTDVFVTLARLMARKGKKETGTLAAQAIRFIEEHYPEKLTLPKIARALSVSPSYLSRIFRRETSATLVSYINQVRIREARRRILARKDSLQEIACQVGVENYNYFYLLFKEICGVTPSDYVRRHADPASPPGSPELPRSGKDFA